MYGSVPVGHFVKQRKTWPRRDGFREVAAPCSWVVNVRLFKCGELSTRSARRVPEMHMFPVLLGQLTWTSFRRTLSSRH